MSLLGYLVKTDTCSEPYQTSTMELFVKIVNGFKRNLMSKKFEDVLETGRL